MKKMRRGRKIALWVVLVMLAGMAAPLAAQQITADVTLMLERLPLEKQEKLKNLADDLEVYLSDYDWTGEFLDSPIPVNVQIVLQDQSVSFEPRYAASFLISNRLDLQYGDKYWRFPYQDGTPLFHEENVYNPFLSFLDYYIYLVLAWEYDKMGKFLGTPYYEKARLISDQAKFNTTFAYGWEERGREVEYFLSEANKPFRQAKDMFFLGLSYAGEVDSTARRYCGHAIDLLDRIISRNPNDDTALKFLQAHSTECIDLFKGDRQMLETFIRIDPDRAETYKKQFNQ